MAYAGYMKILSNKTNIIPVVASQHVKMDRYIESILDCASRLPLCYYVIANGINLSCVINFVEDKIFLCFAQYN